MSDSKPNQGSELNEIVNKRNKWLFTSFNISEYLIKRNNSLLIPSGNIWYLSLMAYPSYSYNSLKLVYFLVKQLFSNKTSFQKKSTHLLVSTGEGYDLKNYNKFLLDNNVEVIHLEAFNTSQKINFNIVKIKSLCSFFVENIREVNSILKLKLPLDLRKKIINLSLPNLAIYTYFCAFLSAIKEQIPNVIMFHSGAVILSMAATRAELETVYLNHGVANKTGVASYPFYDHIYVYSSEEKTYFEDISPNSNVCLYPLKELSKLEKKVIIFLTRLDIHMSEKTISEIFTFFSKKDYQIFLKKHPTYTGSLVDTLAEAYNLEIIACEDDASEIILSLRPSFTIGWGSTALCESLCHGVVPISLTEARTGQSSIVKKSPFYEKFLKFKEKMGLSYSADHPDLDISDSAFLNYGSLEDYEKKWGIYPFKERTLSWKEEKERICELLEDTSLYTRTLSELRMR